MDAIHPIKAPRIPHRGVPTKMITNVRSAFAPHLGKSGGNDALYSHALYMRTIPMITGMDALIVRAAVPQTQLVLGGAIPSSFMPLSGGGSFT